MSIFWAKETNHVTRVFIHEQNNLNHPCRQDRYIHLKVSEKYHNIGSTLLYITKMFVYDASLFSSSLKSWNFYVSFTYICTISLLISICYTAAEAPLMDRAGLWWDWNCLEWASTPLYPLLDTPPPPEAPLEGESFFWSAGISL